MFSIGMFNPTLSKNSLIAGAASAALAVRTNTSLVPLAS